MTTTRRLAAAIAGTALALWAAACDLAVPDLNNPDLGDLESAPTPALVNTACTGLLIGGRRSVAAESGYIVQLGILGREAYNFDSADPLYVTELIAGTLDRGSPFGSSFWTEPYSNIRLGHIILAGVDKVAEFSESDRAGIRGFVHTMQAIDLLEVVVTHDSNGAVIDTDRELGQPLGAIAGRPAALAAVARLLDDGAAELARGGEAFTFPLSAGFHGDAPATTFDTPAGFRAFNRAMRARVAVYMTDYAGALSALSASFLDDTSPVIPFDRGVYYTFSTDTGDIGNGLINSNIYVHPSVAADAMTDGSMVDARLSAKVGPATRPGASSGRASALAFKLYPSPSSRVPQIRNEELVLLKAEALYFTGDKAGATAELNLVRQRSGGLPALTATTDDRVFIDELLYERRYSLLFEGGHRWIDLRRFGRPLPLDRETDTANLRYPLPEAECDARPGEPACARGST